MRVCVVTSDVPFVEGGHLTIARSLIRALHESGHEADLVTTPQNRFGRQFRAYLATALTDVGMDGLGRPVDHVVSLRFPSYAVRHRSHVCWLNHRMREYYDLWPVLLDQLKWKGRIKEGMRRAIIRGMDTHLLKHNVGQVFAQSRTIQNRLQTWGRIPSEVLYPPPPFRKYFTQGYDNFIFAVSRLHPLKRMDLLVEAFTHVRDKNIRAVIIGEGPERDRLTRLVRERGLDHRISLPGPCDETVVLDHFARCRAVFFAPLREDYGFVTGEAFSSRKAVITTQDSGGPAELVSNGKTGYIVPPDPKKIAAAVDELADDPQKAERMGNEALIFISGLTWDNTVRRLLLLD
ncbi:MAG: glycosyltransferase family 4 protein [Acidobacteria bacterium]|nr:glycosyltransferase family 4 protein [Acidobacteriota bacterium]